jgi:hypothetical protein
MKALIVALLLLVPGAILSLIGYLISIRVSTHIKRNEIDKAEKLSRISGNLFYYSTISVFLATIVFSVYLAIVT